MSCQRPLLVHCSIRIRQLNGKTTIIIVTIAYDNIVYDLLSGFLYFCILPMHIGFKFLFILFFFVLSQSTFFSVMSGRSQRFLGSQHAQGHNTAGACGDRTQDLSGVRRPTTTPPRSLIILYQSYINYMYVFILDM